METQMFVTPGLGNSSWLVASGNEAVLVDPQRDVRRFLDAADRRGWRITHVVETHCHNDYLSGALEVREATGAEIVLPARAGYAFPHRRADEGTAVSVGDLRLVAMATPGHTPEHLAWQVIEDDTGIPTAVLTGGSLLAGSAGRTDLLGASRIDELTRSQHSSLRRIAALPDRVRILPTHGSGSFCAAGPPRVERETSLGDERLSNPMLVTRDFDAFRTTLLGGLGRTPAYFQHMAPINRAGMPLLSTYARPGRLSVDRAATLLAAGAVLVDARDRWSFAEAHIPGSIHVEGTDAFASWVGAVVPFGSALVLVTPEGPEAILDELVLQLRRVGYDDVLGSIDGGIDAWAASGRVLRSMPAIDSAVLDAELRSGARVPILDVRQPTEWREGILPGSTTIFVGDLPGSIAALDPASEWTVICRSGARATIAASVLERSGLRVRAVAGGGVPSILEQQRTIGGVPTRG